MPKILIADDSPDMLDTLRHLLSFFQFQVVSTNSGEKALSLSESDKPDLIILDANMPGMDGFEVCKKLKDRRKTKNIPVVILSAKFADEHAHNLAMESGADEYILKPFNSKELISRIKTILKRAYLKGLTANETGLERMTRELAATQKNTKTEVTDNTALDGLTGLYSTKYLWTRLKEEFHRALRYDTPLSLILIDIDSFGQINQTYSYQVGDYILLRIANTILSNTRISDVVARLEGAKFAIILPHTDAQGGFFEAERLRIALFQIDYNEKFLREIIDSKQWRKIEKKSITVSAGVSTYPAEEDIRTEKDLFSSAKKALDRAKTGGKNKTVSIAHVS